MLPIPSIAPESAVHLGAARAQMSIVFVELPGTSVFAKVLRLPNPPALLIVLAPLRSTLKQKITHVFHRALRSEENDVPEGRDTFRGDWRTGVSAKFEKKLQLFDALVQRMERAKEVLGRLGRRSDWTPRLWALWAYLLRSNLPVLEVPPPFVVVLHE